MIASFFPRIPSPSIVLVDSILHEDSGQKIAGAGATRQCEELHFFARESQSASWVLAKEGSARKRRLYHGIDEYSDVVMERIHYTTPSLGNLYDTLCRFWVILDRKHVREMLHAESTVSTACRDLPPEHLTSEIHSYIRNIYRRGAQLRTEDYVTSAPPELHREPGSPLSAVPLRRIASHARLPGPPRSLSTRRLAEREMEIAERREQTRRSRAA